MEKVKNVVIGVLIVGIVLSITILVFLCSILCFSKTAVSYMYNIATPNEFIVYDVKLKNQSGKDVEVPIINLAFENIQEINKANMKDISNIVEQKYVYYVENNVLNVIIRTNENNKVSFKAYKIDTLNGQIVQDNNILLEQYYGIKLNKEKFLEKMKEQIYEKWQEKNNDMDISKFEEYVNSMPIYLGKGQCYVLVSDVTGVEEYQDVVQVNIVDII